jgi:Holliday junction resolvase-like predicted endonuclease
MQISKSSRHSKIVGSFGEQLVCNWLSRSGFEISIVDHTGIDIIAYNKALKQRLGISVKSRTRGRGKESESVNVFQRPRDREHLLAACGAFGCDEAWLAVYVESEVAGDLFLTSLENYDRNYRAGKAVQGWRMTPSQMRRYATDAEVRHIHVDFVADNWW